MPRRSAAGHGQRVTVAHVLPGRGPHHLSRRRFFSRHVESKMASYDVPPLNRWCELKADAEEYLRNEFEKVFMFY